MIIRRKRKRAIKPKLITTIEMEVAIAKYFGIRQNIIVPNISWGLDGMHECDLFFIQRNGYAFEVEIKRSKSDLLADFKKGHNHRDTQHRLQELYYAIPENLYESCKEIIPQNAGILLCNKWIDDDGDEIVSVYSRRPAKKRINARKLTLLEQLKVAKLGTMRIWSLKQKIIKLQNDRTKI